MTVPTVSDRVAEPAVARLMRGSSGRADPRSPCRSHRSVATPTSPWGQRATRPSYDDTSVLSAVHATVRRPVQLATQGGHLSGDEMHSRTIAGLMAYCDWLKDKGYQGAAAAESWKSA